MISLLSVAGRPETAAPALLPLGDRTLLAGSTDRLQRLGAPVARVVTTLSFRHVRSAVAEMVPVTDAPDLPSALRALSEALNQADTDVVLVAAELLLPDDALAEIVLDPRRRTSAAVSSAHGRLDLRRSGGMVVSAGSASHEVGEPDAAFAGVLLVARKDLSVAADAARAMSEAASENGWSGDPIGYLLVALVRRGVGVASVELDPWPWWRPSDGAEVASAERLLAGLDADALRLARATRPDDGFYSTFVVRKLSRRMTPLALRLRLHPNHITVLSLMIGLAAAACFAAGGRSGLVAGALLLQLSLIVDCVDGEVARYTRAFSALGAWLDASTDRIKEYACYAGLVLGAAERGPDLWLLAAAMLALQTTRHTTDYTFTLVKEVREGTLANLELGRTEDPTVRADAAMTAAERAVRTSERSNRAPWVYWTKKVIHLPIGERWLVISVMAAFGGPKAVFVALLGLALLALVYTTTGRIVRARSWPELTTSGRERDVIRAQLDRGPLAALLARVSPWQLPVGRYAWTVPPLLRFLEYAAVIAVVRAVAPGATSAAFALLFAVAYHHYDALYRVLNSLPQAGALHAVGLGVEGRLLVVLVLAAAGEDVLSSGLTVLAAVLAVLFVGVGTLGAVGSLRPEGQTSPSRAAVHA